MCVIIRSISGPLAVVPGRKGILLPSSVGDIISEELPSRVSPLRRSSRSLLVARIDCLVRLLFSSANLPGSHLPQMLS